MKKLIAIALSLCMLTSMVPAVAFATTADTGENTATVQDVSESTQSETPELTGEPATEECTHSWFVSSFVWAIDYSCMAVLGCLNCDETKQAACSVTKTTVTESDCTTEGKNSYIATFLLGGTAFTDTVTETVPAPGHKYSKNKCTVCGEKFLTTPVVKATRYSWSKIKISWNKVENAQGYDIYRANSKTGAYKKIKVASSTATSFIDTGRITNKTYYYKVIAFNGTNRSSSSVAKSASSGLLKPVMKTSVAASKSAVKVSWNRVANAKGYILYRKAYGGSWKKVATFSKGTTLSYTNRSLKAGSYQYAIKAYSKYNGKTIYSSLSAPITTRPLKTPNMELIDSGQDLVNKIKWSTVSGATGYEIYYKKGTNGTWKKAATVGKVNTYTTGTVAHGYYYYYKVRAIYNNGATTKGCFSASDNTMWYYEPDVSVFMSEDSDYPCGAVAMIVTNKGLAKIRIYSANAKLYDHDYSSYDRRVKLYDEDINFPSYIDIPAGEEAIIGWSVIGDDTWYDKKTKIKFKMYYDGVYYWCYASRYYGFSYYAID